MTKHRPPTRFYDNNFRPGTTKSLARWYQYVLIADPPLQSNSPPPPTSPSAIMPKVAQVSRASSVSRNRAGSRVTSGSMTNSPFKSPVK